MQPAPFQISRRHFARRCAVLAAATGVPSWFLEREVAEAATPARPLSANDRPHLALVGCGGMGRGDATAALKHAVLVAVCDVDESHADQAVKQFTKDGVAPQKYRDFRKVMERKDVHAVICATPDHWHTLVNLAAVQAGKDVYGEKPLTLTIDEGRRLVDAVKKAGAVFQTGSQQRSDRKFRLVAELVRNGRLGKLKQVTVWLPAGLKGGPFASSTVPSALDWDFWQGQAPATDYVAERCHRTFRYWLEYSGGTLTDWGAHHNDIARWALGAAGPTAVEGHVVTPPTPGGYTAVSEYGIVLQFADGPRQLIKSTADDNISGGAVNQDGQHHGLRFEGSEGWIWVTRGDLQASDPGLLTTPLAEGAERLYASDSHMGNFFECLRTRRAPICDAEVGHRSATICHLAVIALRLGRKLQWDPVGQTFIGEGAREANQHVERPMRKPYDYSFIA